MKRILFTFLFMILTLTVFSYQTTGLKVYDDLNPKKGVFITYLNQENQPMNGRSDAYYYRRAYKQKNGVKVIADFFISTNTPAVIYQTDKKNVMQGLFVTFYEDGNIYSKGYYKDGQVHGEVTYYSEDGEIEQVDVYDNGTLIEQ